MEWIYLWVFNLRDIRKCTHPHTNYSPVSCYWLNNKIEATLLRHYTNIPYSWENITAHRKWTERLEQPLCINANMRGIMTAVWLVNCNSPRDNHFSTNVASGNMRTSLHNLEGFILLFFVILYLKRCINEKLTCDTGNISIKYLATLSLCGWGAIDWYWHCRLCSQHTGRVVNVMDSS